MLIIYGSENCYDIKPILDHITENPDKTTGDHAKVFGINTEALDDLLGELEDDNAGVIENLEDGELANFRPAHLLHHHKCFRFSINPKIDISSFYEDEIFFFDISR